MVNRARNFSNFRVMDNVSELSNGVLPEMADVFGVSLSQRPTEEELYSLVGAVGNSQLLQENIPKAQSRLDVDGRSTAISWLVRSGIQSETDRSITDPDKPTPAGATLVATGGVANWIDRSTVAMVNRDATQVFLPAGNREMKSPTEVVNPNHRAFVEAYGHNPTESQFMEDIVAPKLRDTGHDVTVVPYETSNGDEIATLFAEAHPQLSEGDFAVVRVAGAGIQLAAQFAKAFDLSIGQLHRLHVITDSFPIDAEGKGAEYGQNPFSGLGNIARTAMGIVKIQNLAKIDRKTTGVDDRLSDDDRRVYDRVTGDKYCDDDNQGNPSGENCGFGLCHAGYCQRSAI